VGVLETPCFPLLIALFLLIGEQGHDLAVGIPEYSAAGAVVGAGAGLVISDAIQGDCLGDEDDLDLKHLILCEVELIFQYSQLAGCSFCGIGLFQVWPEGGVRGLGGDNGMEAGEEQD
jgi:hypothetical protein